ncbi:alpha-mannosidase 2x-like [Argonauta hians]
MKKYMAVWGSLFFFVICVSLYLMMEAVNMNSRANVRIAEFDENDFNSIESKINKVEQDIHKNHGTIREIKKILRHIANGDKASISKLKDLFDSEDLAGDSDSDVLHANPHSLQDLNKGLLGQPLVKPDRELTIPEGVCPALRTQSKAKIKIRHVYDSIPFDNVDGGAWKQGWDVKYTADHWDSRDNLQVFVIPHTHTDPGWLKTFVAYYQQQTKPIFETMLTKLEQMPEMRLIYAEMSFFSMWWDELDVGKRDRVRKLLKEGRLEIVAGGWVMTDEANAHYFAMIDQMIEGHTWLNGTLGVKPQAGWSIDPFGLSPTMAYLLKQMGMKNMLIQRVHYSIKKYLAKTKDLEFLWRQEWDDTGRSDILCHMMPFYSYDVPHTCGPDPKICCQFDFSRLPGMRYHCPWKVPPVTIDDSNVAYRAELLLDQYRKKSQLYRQNIVLVPLGDDFRYDKMNEWDVQYDNYQKLFKYMNSQPKWKVTAKFGTLSDYFNAIYKKHQISPGDPPPNVPSLSGDFFTYSDRDDNYWSGYYTSRPFQKILDRQMENQLRGAEILYFLTSQALKKHEGSKFPQIEFMQSLVNARRNLALFQHHDGITGTARDMVVDDYGDRLMNSLLDMKRLTSEAMTFLMLKDKSSYIYSKDKPLFDIDERREKHFSVPRKTVFKLSETPQPVLFYNSLAQPRDAMVSIHVDTPFVVVRDAKGKALVSQVDLVWPEHDSASAEEFKVSFVASLEALGIAHYTVEKARKSTPGRAVTSEVTFYNSNVNMVHSSLVFAIKKSRPVPFVLENHHMRAGFDGSTGLLRNITFKTGADKPGADSDAGAGPGAGAGAGGGSLPSSMRNMKKNTSGPNLRKTGPGGLGVDGVTHKVAIKFVSYGTRKNSEKSGAYLFLPAGPGADVITTDPFVRIVRGVLCSEASTFLEGVAHTSRLCNSPGPDGLSLDVLNMVDVRDQANYELAMRVTTDIEADSDDDDSAGAAAGQQKRPRGGTKGSQSSATHSFHTDLNGYQMHRRKNYQKLPLQANFYPMPTAMFVEDTRKRFNILSGQSLGAASLHPGQLEVMQDRRLMQDDNRGLAQGVTDNHPTPNTFRFLLEVRTVSPLLETKGQVKHLSLQARTTSLHHIHPVYVAPRWGGEPKGAAADPNTNQRRHNPPPPPPESPFPADLLPSYSPTTTTTTATTAAPAADANKKGDNPPGGGGGGGGGGLSCDVHLLNLRTLQNKDDDASVKFVPQNSAALILHRFAFDCDFPARALRCVIGNGKVELNSLLRDIPLKEVRKTSLSLLYPSSSVPSSRLFLKPNDITTFQVTPH